MAQKSLQDVRDALNASGITDGEMIGASLGVLRTAEAFSAAAIVDCLELAANIEPSVSGKDACLLLAKKFQQQRATFLSTGEILGGRTSMANLLDLVRKS